MKRRLISAALIFALVLVLPGMGTRANPGDSGNEEEAEEDSDTDALEQKRKLLYTGAMERNMGSGRWSAYESVYSRN